MPWLRWERESNIATVVHPQSVVEVLMMICRETSTLTRNLSRFRWR